MSGSVFMAARPLSAGTACVSPLSPQDLTCCSTGSPPLRYGPPSTKSWQVMPVTVPAYTGGIVNIPATSAGLGAACSDVKNVNRLSIHRHRRFDTLPHGATCPIRRSRRRVSGARSTLQDAQDLVESGLVQPRWPVETAPLLSEEGYRVLDVRPVWEYERAHLKSALHVPLFIEDTDNSLLGLVKKGIHMGYGGLWIGTKMVDRNGSFVEQVVELVSSKNDKLVVACGEGLRSLLAVEELHNAGFTNLVWLRGGFNAARANDFPEVEGNTELRFAAIGGASRLFLDLNLFVMNIFKNVSGASAS